MAGALEDVRTYMTTIIGYTDLLLSEAMGSLGDAQRKFLIRIKSGAEHVAQTIRDLARDADSGADAAASAGARVIASPQRPVRMDELVDEAVAARREPSGD
jgi:signal transduction histidine kinase